LEEKVARLKRGKKRRAIPNLNRRFISFGEALASSEPIIEVGNKRKVVVVDSDLEEEVASDREIASVIKVRASPQLTTRLGRVVKKRRH